MKRQIFKLIILTSFMISGCAADLKTKDIVNVELKERSVSVINNYFNLTYVENHAIAFVLFNNVTRNIRMPVIFALPILTTLLCFFLIWKIRKSKFSLLLSPLRKVKIHIFDFFNHSKTSVFANFRLGSCPHEPKLDFSEWTHCYQFSSF